MCLATRHHNSWYIIAFLGTDTTSCFISLLILILIVSINNINIFAIDTQYLIFILFKFSHICTQSLIFLLKLSIFKAKKLYLFILTILNIVRHVEIVGRFKGNTWLIDRWVIKYARSWQASISCEWLLFWIFH